MGVPQAVVMSCSVESFANPKSAILRTASSSFEVQRMFSGWIGSRWYFDISMDDLLGMAEIESVGNSLDDLCDLCFV